MMANFLEAKTPMATKEIEERAISAFVEQVKSVNQSDRTRVIAKLKGMRTMPVFEGHMISAAAMAETVKRIEAL